MGCQEYHLLEDQHAGNAGSQKADMDAENIRGTEGSAPLLLATEL